MRKGEGKNTMLLVRLMVSRLSCTMVKGCCVDVGIGVDEVYEGVRGR
jgi:hypothetical protein